MLRWVILALITLCSPALGARSAPRFSASTELGFSGALLTISSSGIHARTGIDHRTLVLLTAHNRRITMALNDGGGSLGNWSLNLYSVGHDRFVVLSEKDCVSIEAVKGILKSCLLQKPCAAQLGPDASYLGRFDWMNGFDRPTGVFRYGFRYLPFYDAVCGK